MFIFIASRFISPAYIFYIRIQNVAEYKQVIFIWLSTEIKVKNSTEKKFYSNVFTQWLFKSNQCSSIDNLNIRFEGWFIFK